MATSLLESVDQLIHDHKKMIDTIDGFEIHDRPSLLEQLRQAVFGGMERTGGSSSKAKLPVSEAAVDLYTLIDRQIAEAWSAITKRVPSNMRPEQLLAEWSAVVQEDVVVVVSHPEQYERWDEAKGRKVPFVVHAREEYLPLALANRWMALIEDFLNPEKTDGIKAPCLHCGATKVTRRRDGEAVLTDALVFRRDRDTGSTLDARCLNCGVIWPPSRFEFLTQALGIEDKPIESKKVNSAVWSGSPACADEQHGKCRSMNCRCDCHVSAMSEPPAKVEA